MNEQGSYSAGAGKESEEIKKDIERTRDDMGQTIDEIKVRFSPRYMKNRVREATIGKTKEMIETTAAQARSWGESIGRSAKAHPLWYAAGGAGAGSLAWLLMRRRNRNDIRKLDVNELLRTPPETPQAPGRARQTAARVQQKAGQVKVTLAEKVERNPLAFGLITFVAGAMAGFMIPESEWEREWVSKARELFDTRTSVGRAGYGDTTYAPPSAMSYSSSPVDPAGMQRPPV